MNARNFVASTLLAAVLLSIVIVPLSTQQGGGSYDPWLDYNEDGVIDANDLHPLGGAYGTTGDSTKNVSVTNWPTTRELFSENLVLRGTRYTVTNGTFYIYYGVSKYELMDSTTLPPSSIVTMGYEYISKTLNTTEVQLYNGTFVYCKIPTTTYRILGHPAVRVTLNITTSTASILTILKAHAFLGKTSTSGTWTELAYLGLGTATASGQVSNRQVILTMTHIIPVDLLINAQEELAIRLLVYGYTVSDTTNLQLRILHGAQTDYFLVDIPIVKNP